MNITGNDYEYDENNSNIVGGTFSSCYYRLQ